MMMVNETNFSIKSNLFCGFHSQSQDSFLYYDSKLNFICHFKLLPLRYCYCVQQTWYFNNFFMSHMRKEDKGTDVFGNSFIHISLPLVNFHLSFCSVEMNGTQMNCKKRVNLGRRMELVKKKKKERHMFECVDWGKLNVIRWEIIKSWLTLVQTSFAIIFDKNERRY